MTEPSQEEMWSLLEARTRTDYEIPTKWVLAPVAGYFTWATIPIISYLYRGQTGDQLAIPLGILGLAGFTFSAMSSYLVYMLVNRRNTHFNREEALFWTTISVAMSRAPQTDLKTRLVLGTAEQDLARLSETVREHSAVLWALLTLIPYVGWIAMVYVLAFLTRDITMHEQREDLVIENLGRIVPAIPQRATRIPRRPVILYVLASVIIPTVFGIGLTTIGGSGEYGLLGVATFGVFVLPWLYAAVRDPNAHFEYHRVVEPVLAQDSAAGRSVGATS